MAPVFPTELPVQLFLAGYVAALVICIIFLGFIVRYRWHQPAARAFGAISLTLSLWSLGYVGRMLSPALEAKLLWTQLAWVGVTFTPVAVLVFVLVFTGRPHLLSRRRIGYLLVIPVITQGMLLTNDRHGLFYEDIWLHTADSIPLIASRGGLWFFGVHIPYSWALYGIATILLIQFAFVTTQIYRSQTVALIIGALIPWVVNGTFLAGIRLHPELDPTPIGFVAGLAVIGVAAFRLDFLGLVPLARERVVDEMDTALFVLDDVDRLVDVNENGRQFLNRFGDRDWKLGDAAQDVLPAPVSAGINSESGTEQEIRLQDANTALWYLRHQQDLGEPFDRGRIITLNEITLQKRQQKSLERARGRIERERDGKEAIRELLLETTDIVGIAESVCRLLVADHGYDGAWVVRRASNGNNAVELVALIGDHGGLLDESAGVVDPVTERALEIGRSALVPADMTGDGLTETVNKSGHNNVRSSPLIHDGVMFGALTVAGCDSAAQEDTELVAEYAAALAFKHQLSSQRSALRAESIVDVELRIDGGHVLVELTSALHDEETLTAHEVASDEKQATYLIETSGRAADAIEEAATKHESIESFSRVTAREQRVVCQLQIAGPALEPVVGAHGGAIKSMTARAGALDIHLHFPRRTAIGDIVAAITEHWPETTVRSRRIRTVEEDRPGVFENLTEKQEAALRAAVVSGFFDRPQGANATEVAETLGVSRSTFLHHLRAAERKVFGDAFEPERRR